MKYLALAAALIVAGCIKQVPQSHAVHIDAVGEMNGLYSVAFTQDGREWGLEFITQQELDSLKRIP